MNHLQQAIVYNNEGARLLQSGSAVDALQLIRQAVHVLKDFPQIDDAGCCAADYSSACHNGPQQQQSFPMNTHCNNDEEEESLPRYAALYVHRRPLMIPTDLKITTREDLQNLIQMLSSFVVFNLALACHQFGILSGTDAPLERAKELYHVVLTTQPTDNCADNNIISAMRCLALNNLAHLHYEQCDYTYSQYCMECMWDIMDQTGCLDTTTTTSSIVTVWEAEEIKLNVMYAKVPSAAQAA